MDKLGGEGRLGSSTPVNPGPPVPGLRKVMVRAHRQAWCWQDEWYGLSIEDIRQLELETQLALAKKMGHFSQSEEGGAETNGSSLGPDRDPGAEAAGSGAEADGGKLGESLEGRGGLTKQWSTSSRSSNRSSKRGGEGQLVVSDPGGGGQLVVSDPRGGQKGSSISCVPHLCRESVAPEHLRVEDAEHRPGLRGQHGRRVLRRSR